MTTKDAIKLLPLDDKLKMQVLNMYDFMEPDAKRTIERIAWKTYFYQFEEQMQFNIERQFDEVAKGNGTFGKQFYQEAAKINDLEMSKKTDETKGSVDLAAARRAMEQIMNEIHAAKAAKKAKAPKKH